MRHNRTRTEYPASVKEAAVRRYVSSDLSLQEVGEELGISFWSIKEWVKTARKQPDMARKKVPPAPVPTDERSAADKLRLLLEARRLPEAELGVFLRREGLKDGDLDRWEGEALSGLEAAPNQTANERRIRDLEKEVVHHQKRHREASALLELQKKVQALWGDEVDTTTQD
jgi:transposase-like protein